VSVYFFLMLQYNLINNSVNFTYINFVLYILFGRHIFIIDIFLYLPVWWMWSVADISLGHSVSQSLVLGILFGSYNCVYVVFLW